MYYLIKETLSEVDLEAATKEKEQYVAILTQNEWAEHVADFDMGIDMRVEIESDTTKAEVNYDSLTGSFSIPNRECICGKNMEFAFALDERGIVFIDDSGYVKQMTEQIAKTRKWRMPCLERFLYDFMEQTVRFDLKLLQDYEAKLRKLEDSILQDDTDDVIPFLNDIRGDLLDLRTHYEQLIDLGQELEENENRFFADENLRYFRLFTARVERYRDQVLALREYSVQIRDLYQTQIDNKQNKIMTVLTVITTIFFPLSIITGWYGMNFEHMPELSYAWAYPALFGICVFIVLSGLLFFKKKKWL